MVESTLYIMEMLQISCDIHLSMKLLLIDEDSIVLYEIHRLKR